MAQIAQSSAEHIAGVIFQHAARISRENELLALAQLNADLARDLLGAERCSLWLLDERTGQLWTRVAHGTSEIRIRQADGVVGACIAEGRTIIVNDALTEPRFFPAVDDRSGYHTHSMICVPLRTDQQVIGAIQVLNKVNGFSGEDAELLRFMAVYAASAIQSERLRREAEAAMLLRHELALAAEVQRKLLPGDLVPAQGIQLSALCRPATFVGGDFYDFVPLSGGSLAFTLGDVSGKGFPAAVMMASIHTLLRSLLLHNSNDLSSVIAELNDAIYRSSSPERYSTLFCGVLDPERNQLTYVNAGHVPPYIIRYPDGPVEPLSNGDCPVGLLPSTAFQQQSLLLRPGDLVVCVSDGVLEAQNPQGELWDGAVINKILDESRSMPVEQIIGALIRGVDDYAQGSDQSDDMTAVVFQVNRPQDIGA